MKVHELMENAKLVEEQIYQNFGNLEVGHLILLSVVLCGLSLCYFFKKLIKNKILTFNTT